MGIDKVVEDWRGFLRFRRRRDGEEAARKRVGELEDRRCESVDGEPGARLGRGLLVIAPFNQSKSTPLRLQTLSLRDLANKRGGGGRIDIYLSR